MSKIQVIVLFGGESTEHEISCRSATYIVNNLNRDRYDVKLVGISKTGDWFLQDLPNDIIQHPLKVVQSGRIQNLSDLKSSEHKTVLFPILHGTKGEDGCIQGLLDLLSLAYVGPDVLGSASAMDKITAKILVQNAGIPVVPWVDFRRYQWNENPKSILDLIEQKLSYPAFVKAASLGSSVGVYQVNTREELEKSINDAFVYDERILIEEGVDAREIEFAALGAYHPKISEAGEVVVKSDFYSYSSKYEDPNATEVVVPANITREQSEVGKKLARKAFEALNLYGMSRIDFFLDKKSGQLFFNEANTLPGFTEISQYPKLWEQAGLSAAELLDQLLQLALDRREQLDLLKRSYEA